MITTDIAFATDGQIPKTYQYELFLLGAALNAGWSRMLEKQETVMMKAKLVMGQKISIYYTTPGISWS